MAEHETGNPLKLVRISQDAVTRYNQARDRRQRYERLRSPRPGNRHRGFVPYAERPFRFWDGEGPHDAGYALFGNSRGAEICHPFLSTHECLDFLLAEAQIEPAIHIGYGFNYDVSMILGDLPWRCLSALRTYNGTWWDDYEIEHIPGKWLRVKRDGMSVQVFDVHSFFQCSYVQALQEHGIGDPRDVQAIALDKARRNEFVWDDIEDIKRYFHLELKYGPELGETLRASFLGAGYDIRSWHGPGALARAALRNHHVHDAMAVSPPEVQEAARYAFAGGRFEMPRGGHIRGKVYNADKRSAYPAYARNLPNLNRGKWRHTRTYEPGTFGIWNIRYESAERDPLAIHPLFRRERSGTVCWPRVTTGWYHSPEAALVADNHDAEFLDGWVFDEDDPTDRPFAWVQDYYDLRTALKNAGDALQLTYKLIINSVYGQLAQRTGWDRKNRTAPKSHQLEWAGYITSACRAAMYQVAVALGDALISIDTDGVYAMKPIPVVAGKKLGEWELAEYDEGVFWQSGIYALRTDLGYPEELGYGWHRGKTRGIPRGAYSPEQLIRALDTGEEELKLRLTTFVGYGLALQGRYSNINQWLQEERTITFGGQGKRYHNVPFYCAKGSCPGNGIHNFIPPPALEGSQNSYPHYLPWLGNNPEYEGNKSFVRDYELFAETELDWEDLLEWEYS
jgi:DNA polymerase type B, organellar and viral